MAKNNTFLLVGNQITQNSITMKKFSAGFCISKINKTLRYYLRRFPGLPSVNAYGVGGRLRIYAPDTGTSLKGVSALPHPLEKIWLLEL